MNEKDVERLVGDYESQIKQLQDQRSHQAIGQATNDLVMQQNNDNHNIVREQLDLTEELVRIDYLLRGYSTGIDANNNFSWLPPTDDSQKILSDYGVSEIRQIIGWYINKNVLLSNFYESSMINEKMRTFGHALNNLVMMKYEKIFLYPSVNVCKQELLRRIQKRVDIKTFAYELVGVKVSTDDLRSDIIKQLEPVLEKELEKIRQQLMADKYKRFEMMMVLLLDIVHATLLRAYMGEERASIRRHSNIMELRSPTGMNGGGITDYKGAFGLLKK